MVRGYTNYLKTQTTPIREQLIAQLVSGQGDDKTEHLRGQIKAIDRLLKLIDDAAHTYLNEVAPNEGDEPTSREAGDRADRRSGRRVA